MRIVFTDVGSMSYEVDLAPLRALGTVVAHDCLADSELGEAVRDADILVTNQNRVDAATLAGADHLRLVCQAATGYDNIDVSACKAKGIGVANVPGYAGPSVAQHTFAMLFYLLSHSRYYDEYVKTGRYASQGFGPYPGRDFFELAGKTWGIYGLGSIGQRVAALAEAFGCRVCYTPVVSEREDPRYERLAFAELLGESDILSIHAALGPASRDRIGRAELAQMKPSAILLNLGRGGIVDEAALAEALEQGTIAAAGLDVLELEPIPPDHPLLRLPEPDRIYITPHIAFGSREARQRLMEGVAANIRSFLEGGTANRVDL